MASSIELNNKILEAQNVLAKAFGEPEEGEDKAFGTLYSDSTKYLQRESLKIAYEKDASIERLTEIFSNLSKNIRSMKSGFLPIDFFLDSSGFFSESITESVSESESYENAFMRMLGMPSSDRIAYAESVGGEGSLYIVTPDGKRAAVSFEDAQRFVLDERQKARSQRRVLVNTGNIYNIDSRQQLTEAEITDFILDTTADINNIIPPTIDKLDTDFFKFSYLMFPPVQDSRISKCINEPSKIVAEPFSNKRARVINQNKIKPTLLESIIRIRLDRLSGTDSFESAENVAEGISDLTPDTYGVLEALFVLRIESAIRGLGLKMAKDIDKILSEFEKTQIRFTESGADNQPDDASAGLSDELSKEDLDQLSAELSSFRTELAELDKKKAQFKKKNTLENQRIIEDSILALLGSNSEVLDLQIQTQRNSSIRDSHLMSPLAALMNLPGKIIDDELKAIEKSRKDGANGVSDPKRSEINKTLGVDIGVGNVDVLAFCLAMFTVSEGALLGLLSDDAFDRLKEDPAFAGNTLPERKQILPALSEFSDFVYSAYQSFIFELVE